MSNVHLKITIEENWRSQNFDFLSLKNSAAPTHTHIIGF